MHASPAAGKDRICLLIRPLGSEAPASVREQAGRALARWGLAALIDDVSVVVSELVTNALNAAAGQATVLVERHPDAGMVHVAVWDDAPGKPEPCEPDFEAECGRGLHIVRTLAAGWGYDLDHSGKTVWADLPVRQG